RAKQALKAQLSALRELGRLTRLVEAGLLALDDSRVAREETRPLERHAQLRVELDESACDAVPHRAGLPTWTAAVHAHADAAAAATSARPDSRSGGGTSSGRAFSP